MISLASESDAGLFCVFTDIHSNHSALSACVADLLGIEAKNGLKFSRYILGDVLDTGPLPRKTLELVCELSDVHIRGNHEDYLFEHITGQNRSRYASRLWRYVPWTIEQLGEQAFRDYFSRLKFDWVSPDRFLHLMHASFDRNDSVPAFVDWKNASKIEEIKFHGKCIQIRVMGHSHLAGVYQQPGGVVWVNAGSVGYPFIGKGADESFVPFATYLLGAYSPKLGMAELVIRRVPYSLESILSDYAESRVLELCAPYSRGVFLQTILNKSIIYQALAWAKKNSYKPDHYVEALTRYLEEFGFEKMISDILNH